MLEFGVAAVNACVIGVVASSSCAEPSRDPHAGSADSHTPGSARRNTAVAGCDVGDEEGEDGEKG